MQRYRLNPNNEVIKKLVRDYPSGNITTLYGNAASGKTTTCLLAAIEAAKTGKVIFIDTESGFNASRFGQLSGDIKILDNIFLLQPKSYKEQYDQILKLKELCRNEKIKLIVIDTIGNHYRNILKDEPKIINGMMIEQTINLIRVARDLNKVILVTNQVSGTLEKDEFRMVGGKLIKNMSKCIIELNKKENKRFASLVKYKLDRENVTHYNIGKTLEYEIKEKGMLLAK